MKIGTKLSILFFILVTVAHVVRLITGAEIIVGGWATPRLASVFGAVVPALLAWLLWKESR